VAVSKRSSKTGGCRRPRSQGERRESCEGIVLRTRPTDSVIRLVDIDAVNLAGDHAEVLAGFEAVGDTARVAGGE